MGDNDEINVHIEIPFPTKRLAEIAYHVLRVDSEPKRGISKELSYKENILHAKFTCSVAKQIRVAVNSYFENLRLITETIDFIGEPYSDAYDHY